MGKVLLIEDSQVMRQALAKILERRGHEVVTAEDGLAGWDAMRASRPDVVLSDLMMPRLGGLELTRRIRADSELADVYVILLTALGSLKDRVAGLEGGADDYLVKPVQPEELIARIGAGMRFVALRDSLKAKNRELENLNQQKDEILGVAAHDLRSPLTAISGWAQLLVKKTDQTPPLFAQGLEAIAEQSQFMMRLIADILDIQKIKSGKLSLNRKVQPPGPIVERCTADHRPHAEHKRITLRADVAGDVADVEVDALRLSQAINNLINNAIKFTADGGRVEVRARSNAGKVELAVADNGLGIAEEEIPRLFEEFSQTSTRATADEMGSGLGLAITRKIVEMHGGQIEVQSRRGEGSTFTIRLPAACY